MRFNGINCIIIRERTDQLPMDFKESVIVSGNILNIIPILFL